MWKFGEIKKHGFELSMKISKKNTYKSENLPQHTVPFGTSTYQNMRKFG